MNTLLNKIARQSGFVDINEDGYFQYTVYGTTMNTALENFARLLTEELENQRKNLSQFDRTTPFGDGYERGLNDMAESFKELIEEDV